LGGGRLGLRAFGRGRVRGPGSACAPLSVTVSRAASGHADSLAGRLGQDGDLALFVPPASPSPGRRSSDRQRVRLRQFHVLQLHSTSSKMRLRRLGRPIAGRIPPPRGWAGRAVVLCADVGQNLAVAMPAVPRRSMPRTLPRPCASAFRIFTANVCPVPPAQSTWSSPGVEPFLKLQPSRPARALAGFLPARVLRAS